ncbi:hypothetical protein BDF19DRAFT_426065 [Syncephalis fuscata]|nr:hypothetical protein BDF19DRAFT_426065 [Syncephalis fuscata]
MGSLVTANEHSHRYSPGEQVVVWRNTIGPFDNRQETYAFDQLPYCRPTSSVMYQHESLGEVLQGMELVDANMGLLFLQDQLNKTLCKEYTLDHHQIAKFRFAIEHNYWYELIVDELPVWAFVGKQNGIMDKSLLVYTHQNFTFYYNNDQIIEVYLEPSNPIQLPNQSSTTPLSIHFTYSVQWIPTKKTFTYVMNDMPPMNSFHLRFIDYIRYDREVGLGDLDCDLGDEYGWKQLYGDTFRPPRHLCLFAALLGTGYHLFATLLLVVGLHLFGHLFQAPGEMTTAILLLYAVTSFIASYISGRYYRMYGGRRWIRCTMVTAGLWPTIAVSATLPVNIIASVYSSTRAIPFTTILSLVAIWLFLICPLSLFGAVFGRNHASRWEPPCRVHPVARMVPEPPKYLEPVFMVILTGFLPFCSIFTGMYYILVSFWSFSTFYIYGFTLMALCLLACLTSSIAVLSTYHLLNAEEHRWHWRSFLAGGSVAFYIYLYIIYFFFANTKMTGLFQTSLYFANMTIGCGALFVALVDDKNSGSGWNINIGHNLT